MEETVDGEEEPVQEEEVGPATTEPAGPQLDELLARLPTLMNRKFVDEVRVCVCVWCVCVWCVCVCVCACVLCVCMCVRIPPDMLHWHSRTSYQFAVEFCLTMNTKLNRRKLANALFSVDRNR